MSDEHYVVVGLAQVRSSWFSDLSRWSTSAALPVDFVKCVSPDELHARLQGSRPYSAVIVDGALAALDRDLVDRARSHGTPVIAVDTGHAQRDWEALDVSAVLLQPLDRDTLLTTLRRYGRPLGRLDESAQLQLDAEPPTTGWRGRLVAVTGAPGSGRSTIAGAIAQGLATDVRHAGRVVLADLALDADQALLHDVGDVIPGVQELVEAHRGGVLSPDELRAITFADDARGYSLLLGLRRHRDWASLRPRAFEAGLEGLRRSFTVTVADVDADVEGESDCGSVEVEDRNLMARAVTARADLVVVTSLPTLSGIHRFARIIENLLGYGVEPHRVMPVVNRSPRSLRGRSELARALADATGGVVGSDALPSPVYVPERRRLDDCYRDGVPLPRSFVAPMGTAVQAVLDRVDSPNASGAEPERVAVGSLGSWADPDEGV
jgi:hypothetical protein